VQRRVLDALADENRPGREEQRQPRKAGDSEDGRGDLEDQGGTRDASSDGEYTAS
jgi:hypothetical protein